MTKLLSIWCIIYFIELDSVNNRLSLHTLAIRDLTYTKLKIFTVTIFHIKMRRFMCVWRWWILEA